ncbi:hypothetical protein HanIR_Chr08g0348001 [Helianthus annuus]|nr:hypothetical protein HanIR_Chr08g0348001 [Helianthus annuus]
MLWSSVKNIYLKMKCARKSHHVFVNKLMITIICPLPCLFIIDIKIITHTYRICHPVHFVTNCIS